MNDPRDIDPDAPPTAEEIAASSRLREALDDPRIANEAAELARAVALAHGPRAIEEKEHRAIVDAGIARGDARAKRARGRVTRLAFAGGGALAMAAALALVVGGLRESRSPSMAAAPAAVMVVTEPLVPVRSTQPLFREPFARAGGESARIDRIASARAGDLRDNRFAKWGVR